MATKSTIPAPPLRFEIETEALVHCSGRLTLNSLELLKATVKPLIEENDAVVLDLANVEYMDSSGLGAIVGLYASARAVDCQLRLVNLSQRVKELLSITRLIDILAKPE